jgi:tripartite-type tricarboxylate transporter receptor subunit TctC
VSGACTLPLALVVNNALPAKDTQELIALLKANPGKYSYASPGLGTVQHFAMEFFPIAAGVDLVHIPYKGAAPMMPDIISGQVPIAMMSASPAIAQARAGRMRSIALTTIARLPNVPDWPTLAETLPGFDAAPNLFVLAPGGTPQAVVQRLNDVIRSALATKEVLDGFEKQGATATPSTPEQLGGQIAAEVRRWGELAKNSGIKPE